MPRRDLAQELRGSQRPQAPPQLGQATGFINRLHDARKSLAVIVPTNDRRAYAARPLNVGLGVLVSMHCVDEYQGWGWAVINPIEFAFVHSHLLALSPLHETKQHLGR